MMRRPGRALSDPGTVLLVASDPQVIAATRDAVRQMAGPPPVLVATSAEALSHMLGPGAAPRHLVVENGAGSLALFSAAQDPFNGTEVVVITRPGQMSPPGLRQAPAEAKGLAAMLAEVRAQDVLADCDAPALAAGLTRGEITVRFQPMVSLADRRPMLVEALARWERPGAALGASEFVPLAEQAGLGPKLTFAVAQRAISELAAHRGNRRIRLSFNLPLSELLKPSLPVWLGRLTAESGLTPHDVLLELTESTQVRDRSLLRRALMRLARAGFGVLLDDLSLDDGRRGLLALPFAGVKLDRSLVIAMPSCRRARGEVERIVRHARRHGMLVIAEGVMDSHVWRAAAAAGCDMAQGFGVGRPLPPASLPAWVQAWRAAATPVDQAP
ncbi:EAL domain-containing protein [Roseomonas sp. F4]